MSEYCAMMNQYVEKSECEDCEEFYECWEPDYESEADRHEYYMKRDG